ncbi:hypothetical protein QVD17_00258 [Tagetes erecta]|uniref:PHD-type domain-containing protein n=1 Tax=Tagetes erecta TaxID=13708 RepID=A0AAD8L5G5_TARER|nr:hypothetical protein QVD17_00258 [Tagetes erecta]
MSRTVIKKKKPSASLVTNNKVTDHSSSTKKRVRLVESESSDSFSESSDKSHNASVPCKGGLDVFEFDEYDRFDDTRIKKDAKAGTYIRNSSYGESADRMDSRSGFEMEEDDDDDDESDLPLSVLRKKYRSSSGKSVKLQGKNGVLKVTVDKNKQMGVDDHVISDNLKERESRAVGKKMLHGEARNGPTFMSEDGNKNKEKSRSRGGSVKSKGIVKKVSNVKVKESKIKSGISTEKQILREKIKSMLVDAGWTIDYRPRRNKDYIDAVYVSPSGTGYWSIVKAYDAFQKEEEGDSGDLRDEVLGKLSRQTQQKTEIRMKSKRKVEDEKEVNLNSYGRKSRKLGRCSLLVRNFDKAENHDGFVPYSGKRTLLSWLLDSGVVHLREHVEYVNGRKTKVLQKGWITKDGIHCGCCNKNVTFWEFEVHAGGKLGDPFRNIILESGKSLMQCHIDAWNKQGELERKGFYTVDADGDDPNDDTCGPCGDGGDLICCDGCPSTFHQACLELPMLPQGDWFCPNCSCKYCEIACTNPTQAALLTCHLCQKKYHESCKPEIDVKPIESNYPNLSFCGHSCHELYSRLQKLVGVKHELDSEFSWSLIHRSELSMDESSVQHSQQVECNSMLAVAMSVMDECFLPFTDRRSGINLIRNVVFNCGSNLSRLNYSGFYTAILERGDEVICAASIRVHGTQLAEMPFIGTRYTYRRQGMCRRLLSAIETALSSLQVEKLMIPAVPEHMDTWTDVFGFHRLQDSDKQGLRCMNMLVFPRTDMLKKTLRNVNTDSGSRDDATTETVPINSPSEPKLTGSHSEADAAESTVQVANGFPLVISGEPETQLLSNANLEETDVQNVDSCETKAPKVPCNNSVSSDAHGESDSLKVKESTESDVETQLRSDANIEETDVQNIGSYETEAPKVPCNNSVSSDTHGESVSLKVKESPESDVETKLHSDANLEETGVKNVDLCETETPKVTCNNSVSSDSHNESVSLKESKDSDVETRFHSNANLEETDVQNVDSCETEAPKTHSNNNVSSDADDESVSLKVKEPTDSDIGTQLHSDADLEETNVPNVDPCEAEAPKVPCNDSVSSDAHGESVSSDETDLSVKPSDAKSRL